MMCRFTIGLGVALLLGLLAGPGAAQPLYLQIDTNLPEAAVYADSVKVGTAAQALLTVPATTRTVRLVPPGRDTWSIPPEAVSIDAAPGDTLRLDLAFPYHHQVESIPFGATVYLETAEGWEPLGETPLVYTSAVPLDGRLVVEQPGYVVERLTPGTAVWNRYNITLSPSKELIPQAAEVEWRPPRKHRAWIDYVAVGTALAAGAAAVYYKFEADALYREYERTSDPALRPEIERFDRYSGVALGTMQVGLGVFAVRLVLR